MKDWKEEAQAIIEATLSGEHGLKTRCEFCEDHIAAALSAAYEQGVSDGTERVDPTKVAILATWYSLFCVLMDGPDGPDLKRLLALRQELIRQAPELEAKFLALNALKEAKP